MGRVNRKIVVQADLGIKTSLYSKKLLQQKELAV
jgi:hypothetical protein